MDRPVTMAGRDWSGMSRIRYPNPAIRILDPRLQALCPRTYSGCSDSSRGRCRPKAPAGLGMAAICCGAIFPTIGCLSLFSDNEGAVTVRGHVIRHHQAILPVSPQPASGTGVLATIELGHSFTHAASEETERFDLVDQASVLLGIFTAIYVTIRAILELFPQASSWFSFSADAQTITQQIITRSTRDPFDWFVALVIALVMFSCILVSAFTKSASKTKLSHDVVKIALGFFGGFLGSGSK